MAPGRSTWKPRLPRLPDPGRRIAYRPRHGMVLGAVPAGGLSVNLSLTRVQPMLDSVIAPYPDQNTNH